MREILLATGNPGKAREMREILAGVDALAGKLVVAPGDRTLADKLPVAQALVVAPGDRTLADKLPVAQVRWRYLSEFADAGWPEPVEDGPTFIANAEIKARHYARLSGLWTIADDSGLVVDALGGEPGVRSARYAGEPKNDDANNALLIRKLAGVPRERRTARFCCAVVLVGETSEGLASRGLQSARASERTADAQDLRVIASAEGAVEGFIVDEARGNNGFGYDPHFWSPMHKMTMAEMSPDMKHAISHRGQALRRLREKLATM